MLGAKHGRGAVAPASRRFRRSLAPVRLPIGASILAAMTIAVPMAVSPGSPAMKLSADSTALLLCGTTCPTFHDAGVEAVMDKFVTPTHPDQSFTPIAVTTPNENWPLTGIFRLLGLLLGDPGIFGPGGPAWPDEPWWKLSGLFDLTADQSIEAGAADLEAAMAAHPDDRTVIYGLSQGAAVANVVKNRLAAKHPEGPAAPDIDFVLQGSAHVPNGGLSARFPGLHIPILDWTFDGPGSTATQFDTVYITRQYDGFADFPLYPLNVIADLNAVLGILYLHTRPFDDSLPPDPTTSPAYQGTHGDSSFYFFETQDLPLFAPLRMLGVPEPLIDIVEPFFRVLVELGYDRSIPPWEPTPARLFPKLDIAEVVTDFGQAIGEGIDNAIALIDLPPRVSTPAPATGVSGSAEVVEAEAVQDDMTHNVTSTDPSASEELSSTEPATEHGQASSGAELSTTEVTGTEDAVEASTDDATSDQVLPASSRAHPPALPHSPGAAISTGEVAAVDQAMSEGSSSGSSAAPAPDGSSSADSAAAGESSGGGDGSS